MVVELLLVATTVVVWKGLKDKLVTADEEGDTRERGSGCKCKEAWSGLHAVAATKDGGCGRTH